MDEKTIDNARCGDRRAQAQILRELQDAWFRFCLGLLGDVDRARDATQETAARFLEKLPTWRGDGSLKTWSFGIALNVVREMRRQPRETQSNLLFGGPATAGSSPDESAESTERSQLLHDALLLLPERQREALMLRFFENLTTEETAGAMHCAVGTVKATVHQALRTLRGKLRQLT